MAMGNTRERKFRVEQKTQNEHRDRRQRAPGIFALRHGQSAQHKDIQQIGEKEIPLEYGDDPMATKEYITKKK